jgi:CheY-like chemotaxis protein
VAAPPDPTVVVHDDDPAIVSLFQRHLGGYRVVGAPTPDDAVALAARRSAQAILTDAPPAEEQEVWHRRWLEVATRTGTPVLGCPMPSGRRLARALGLVDYLVKPVTRDELLASIQAVAPEARTILVVDDEPKLVRLFCRMLQAASRDYRLLRAHDGQQALDLAREAHPDLVLLDLLMPQVDGLTVLEKLRRDAALATIPVVAVSARGVFEAIVPSSNRTLILVGDRPFPVSRLVDLTRVLLDSLPPAGGERSSSVPGPPAGVAGSVACG